MQISNRTLTLSILIGLLLLCGCVAVYFFTFRSLTQTAAEPPPGNVQATAPAPTDLPTSESPSLTAVPALPERRRLTLEFPPRIRVGDSDLVRLTLEVDDLGNVTPTAQIGGNVVTGKVIEIPNLYETHNVIAETRFDIAGMEVRPAESVSESLSPGASITFYWSIRPPEAGAYDGTIWLHLRFVNKANGEESRKAIAVQLLEIKAVNFLGLSGNLARTMGVVGSIGGTVIGFPFLEDILKLIWKKRNKQNR